MSGLIGRRCGSRVRAMAVGRVVVGSRLQVMIHDGRGNIAGDVSQSTRTASGTTSPNNPSGLSAFSHDPIAAQL